MIETLAAVIKGKNMAEETAEEKTDIFYAQEQMIENLTDLFMKQDQQEQPLYVAPPAPIPRPRNYLLYIALGIGILIYMGKIKLGKIL